MTKRWIFAVLLVCLGNPAFAGAQSKHDPSRGELLYTTHCIACHTTEIHWRDKTIAKNLNGLNAEVSHWQKVTGQAWSDDDVAEVAHYLNALYYHFPEHAR